MPPSLEEERLAPSTLCPECELILSRAWQAGIAIPPGHPRWDKPIDTNIVYPWHPTLAAVRESVDLRGCHFCAVVCRYAVPVTPSVDWQKPLTVGFNHDGYMTRNDLALMVTHGEHTLLQLNLRYSRDQVWEGDGCGPLYGHHDNTGQVPPSLFAMLRDWTTHCESDHAVCSKPLHKAAPSRLIEIGGGDEETPRVRLVDANQDVRGLYATLSHCWGPNPDMKRLPRTTADTLDAHYQSIPYDALSATFKDAITVAYNLGLHYLWIDSLCIIQQDKADWERESVKMADIYANSFVTIAATGSRGVDEGLYLLRREQEMTPVLWRTPEDGKLLAFHPLLARNYLDYETIPRPLYSRAWCMQELTLSRRVLHFLPGQVIWDCSATTSYEFESMAADSRRSACLLQRFTLSNLLSIRDGRPLPPTSVLVDMERKKPHSAFSTVLDLPHSVKREPTEPESIVTVCFGHPNRVGDFLQNLRQVFTKVPKKKPAIGTKASRAPKTIYDEWRSLVENYGTKDITFREDRLPAIWSFAERMREIANVDDRYLCGVWRDDIPHGLTFMLYTPSATPEPPLPAPPAPSWSWAAHEGRIRYYGDGRLHGLKKSSPDPLKRPEFVGFETEVSGAAYAAMGRSIHARLTLKCISAPITGTPDPDESKKLLRQGYVEMALDSSQLLSEVPGHEIVCVHMMDFCGLLVRPSKVGSKEFERVGLCYARHQGKTSMAEIERSYLDLAWEEREIVLI